VVLEGFHWVEVVMTRPTTNFKQVFLDHLALHLRRIRLLQHLPLVDLSSRLKGSVPSVALDQQHPAVVHKLRQPLQHFPLPLKTRRILFSARPVSESLRLDRQVLAKLDLENLVLLDPLHQVQVDLLRLLRRPLQGSVQLKR
jgi:hypothetical protein